MKNALLAHSALLVAAIALCIVTDSMADDTLTLQSADGQYQLIVPKGWHSADFHAANIEIGASYPHRGEYAEVVADPQKNYSGSLEQFAEAKRDTMAMCLDNPRLSQIQAVKVHGQDAYRFQLHGSLPGSSTSIGYCVTILATKTHYIQIIGWTLESHFAANSNELFALAQGFSEKAETGK